MLRPTLISFLAIACCLALLRTSEPAGAAPQPKKADVKDPAPSLDLTVNGALAQGDPIDQKLMQPSKVHAMKLPKGKFVQVDLESTDFDAYLRILDSNDNELAFDDDGGGNLNARIFFPIPKDDAYKIVAITLNGNVGNYKLTVKPLDPPVVKVKAPAAGKSESVTDKLSNDVPLKIFEVELGANDYQIDMVSNQFDSFLHLLAPDGTELAKDDDSGGNLNARIVHSIPAAGKHRILARSYNGAFGEFTLTVQNNKN